MTRGNNQNAVFRRPDDYQQYLRLATKYKKEHPFDIFHYCLMPNHTHFLIRTQNANDYSTFMKKLGLAYFQYFKKTYSWVGHFWQDRYKSQPVGKDEHFLQCGKYIELNPIRAGIVDNPGHYPYSSYSHYAYGTPDELITEDIFYQSIGKMPSQKQEQYQEMIISEIVDSTYRNRVWGVDRQKYNEEKKMKYHLRKKTNQD